MPLTACCKTRNITQRAAQSAICRIFFFRRWVNPHRHPPTADWCDRSSTQSRKIMSALYYDCLLGLPETSDAFSTHPKIVNVHKNKGLEKHSPPTHPHKAPRLTRDADSASASRSRASAPSAGGSTGGATLGDDVIMVDAVDEDTVVPVMLRVEGAPCMFSLVNYSPAHPNV